MFVSEDDLLRAGELEVTVATCSTTLACSPSAMLPLGTEVVATATGVEEGRGEILAADWLLRLWRDRTVPDNDCLALR